MVTVWQSAVRTTRPPRRTLAGLNLALVAFSIGLLAFPASIFAKEEPTVNISVLVYNYAGVAPGTLAGAEHQADRILNQAGVRAVWIDCSVKPGKLDEKSICRSGWGYQNIVLRLLSRHIPTRVPDFTFGFAVSPGLASVYYGDAAIMAERHNSARTFHFSWVALWSTKLGTCCSTPTATLRLGSCRQSGDRCSFSNH